MSNIFVIESFIEYCDNMVIANEGVIKDAIKENPMTGAGLAVMAISGLYIGGQVVKAKIDEKKLAHKRKKAMNTIKKNANTVYMLSDSKMENVFKVSGKVYPSIDKKDVLLAFTKSIPVGADHTSEAVQINEKFKSILNTKLYLYTLDGSRTTIDNSHSLSYDFIISTEDLPIKNVEEGTYGELLKSHNIEIEILKDESSIRTRMIKQYSKEIRDFLKNAGVDKGLTICGTNINDAYGDLNEKFIYGFDDTAYLVSWDLWDFNPRARTDDDKNNIFYNAQEKILKIMNEKYPNIEFDDGCDWDGGCFEMIIKKK